jgi:hypothetical protein
LGGEERGSLDQYQIRRYDARYARMTLSLAAAAFLTIVRAAEAAKGASSAPRTRAAPTVNEIRLLFATLNLAVQHATKQVLAWSNFRQRCLQRARAAHYRKRLGSYDPP